MRFVRIICLLYLSGSAFSASAQECKKFVPDSKIEVQEFKSVNEKNYEGWKKIEIPNRVSFYVPNKFVKVEKKDIRGNHPATAFLEFKSDSYKLGGDFTTYAYFPDFTKKKLSNYCEWYSWIDGAFAYFWNFEDANPRYKYESGIYFQFKEDSNYRMSIYLQSLDKNTKEIAEKIFKSITFLNKPVEQKTSKNKIKNKQN